jgi:DNA-binding transcriptional MerR regulator
MAETVVEETRSTDLHLTRRQVLASAAEVVGMGAGCSGWSVGEVAAMTASTVRTLHHYDALGLVSPSGRTAAGHRRYQQADLERLQQVLFYRALGFGLDAVAELLDDPDADPMGHLLRQQELLAERAERLRLMAQAVATAIRARQSGVALTPEEMFEVFGDIDPTQYADEARERWGETEAYAESTRRTSRYTKDDWARIKAATEDLERRFAAAQAAGEPADGTVAMDLAEEHRRQIHDTYYDLSYAMHRGLAAMYVDDPRFAQHYDDVAPGLARYVHDAIMANADRAEA